MVVFYETTIVVDAIVQNTTVWDLVFLYGLYFALVCFRRIIRTFAFNWFEIVKNII